MKKFFKEFKDFITRGNILDMAVGVIVGGAFNTIVQTLNKQVLMPIVNWALSYGTKGSEVCTVLKGPGTVTWAEYVSKNPEALGSTPTLIVNGVEYYSAIYINWSAFIESIINFLFVALTLFIIVKVANSVHKKLHARQLKEEAEKKAAEEEAKRLEEEAKANAPKPVTEIDLLNEIVTILKKEEK